MWIARTVALALAIVATGLAAGFFYAYDVSVTRGLAIVDDRTYVETMQAINSTVRNAPFALSFFGALLLSGIALMMRVRKPRSLGTWLVAAGFLLYAGGVFAVTFAFNVPLNDELAGYKDLAAVDVARARADYESDWNMWNNLRTVSALASLTALVGALLLERPGRRAVQRDQPST
jgi:uncharacterized membrane protein